jgi:hypothetical protein
MSRQQARNNEQRCKIIDAKVKPQARPFQPSIMSTTWLLDYPPEVAELVDKIWKPYRGMQFPQ